MRHVIFFLLIIAVSITACKEDDDRGQFAIDSIPPGVVTNVTVQNEKGFSIVSYSNPLDEDLLYVEANYVNSLGNQSIVRASAYSNSMKLNGFLRSKTHKVKLFAVDKSFNKSEIVEAEIEPLDNPMFDILSSMNFNAVFGGVGLQWENTVEQEVVVEFLTHDVENNTYSNYKNFYTKAPELDVKVRGLEAVESQFGVVVRDEFGQRTDTTFFSLTPLFEEEIDSEKFRQMPHNPDFDTKSYSMSFSSLFNREAGGESYSIFGSGIGKVYFTMDFGEEIKLSRFKMWSRNDFTYAHSQPRHIVLVGTNDEDVANDPYSESGWTEIGEWYDEKPSGNPASTAPTDEDKSYFNAGMDFEVDVAAGTYRYIRFVTLESWGKTDRMWLAELRFWGQKVNGDE
jgi:hypothetical protein